MRDRERAPHWRIRAGFVLLAVLLGAAIVGGGWRTERTQTRPPDSDELAGEALADGELAARAEADADSGPIAEPEAAAPDLKDGRREAPRAPTTLEFTFALAGTTAEATSNRELPGPTESLNGLVELAFESPVSGPFQLDVRRGRASFELSPARLPEAWSPLAEAEAASIRFADSGLFRAHALDQVLAVESIAAGDQPHCFEVRLRERGGWPIEIVSASAIALADHDIEIRSEGATEWNGPATLEPSPSIKRLDLDVRDGRVKLPPPASPNAIYWIGAPGHAWFALRWSRRTEFGPRVELEPMALLELEAPPTLVGRVALLDLDHPSRMWVERPLLRRKFVIEERLEIEVPPGRHLLSIRGSAHEPDLAGLSVLEPRTLLFEPGVRQTLSLHDPSERSPTSIRILHGAEEQGFRWTLHYLGSGRPGERPSPVANAPGASDDQGFPVRTLAWPSLRAGYYSISIDDHFALAFERPLGAVPLALEFDISELVTADLYLPQRQDLVNSEPAPAPSAPLGVWVTVVLGEDEDWPRLPTPPILQPAAPDRIVSVTGPLGAKLRVSYHDAPGVEWASMTLGDERTLQVPLKPRSLTTWAEDSPRPPFGWQSGVRLRDRTGTLLDVPPVVTVGFHGMSGIGTNRDDVGSIFLPAYSEAPSLGRWVDLPPPPATTPFDSLLH